MAKGQGWSNPVTYPNIGGVSLRDEFAKAALTGFILKCAINDGDKARDWIVERSYEYADAMLLRRGR